MKQPVTTVTDQLTEWLHNAGSYCDIGEGDEENDGVCDGRCRVTADESVTFLKRLAAAEPAMPLTQEPAPAGFVIAGWQKGVLVADWDEAVYTSREDADRSIGQARRTFGFTDYQVYALYPCADPAEATR